MTKATIVGNGASTQSRGRRPGRPVTLSHCSGVYEHTTDGRKILSWPMGQYGGLLGYPSRSNPFTEELLLDLPKWLGSGKLSLGSYPPESEQFLADKLVSLYSPYLRSPDIGVRFASNGTDVTQMAVALARYATGREAFVSVGYHGGSSPVFTTPPQDGGVLRANGEGRLDKDFSTRFDGTYLGDCSSIIIEVPAVEDEIDVTKKLARVSSRCKTDGVYFILDDIVTGFRFAPAGALEYYSNLLVDTGGLGRTVEWGQTIQADFVCLGKALSTYGKVSVLLGPLDIMEALADKVFASYTFNDHPLGFADALWTLGEYEKWAEVLYSDTVNRNGILSVGLELRFGLNILFAKYGFPAKCIGHPARSAIFPTDDGAKLRTLLSRIVDEHDVLLHMPQFTTLAHNLEHVKTTLTAVETVLKTWQ